MEEIKLFFINKSNLELKKATMKFYKEDRFPKELRCSAFYFPYTIKLKKDGSLMQTGDTGFYIFTESQKREMLKFINYLLKERRREEKQLQVFRFLLMRRF